MVNNMAAKNQDNTPRSGNDYLIASKFAEEIYPEFTSVIKSIIFFGSSSRNDSKSKDIDILIIFNDSEVISDNDFKIYFNNRLDEAAKRISEKIHLNVVTLTVFFQNLINSEPVVLNILRDGISIIDTGFFNPLKILLLKGDLKPSPEAILNCAARVSQHLNRSKINVLSACQELYLACLDASQASLMAYGQVAPSPSKVPELLEGIKVKEDLISIFIKLQKLFKDIEYRKINEFLGKDFDKLNAEANYFIKEMEKRLKKKI